MQIIQLRVSTACEEVTNSLLHDYIDVIESWNRLYIQNIFTYIV